VLNNNGGCTERAPDLARSILRDRLIHYSRFRAPLFIHEVLITKGIWGTDMAVNGISRRDGLLDKSAHSGSLIIMSR